VLIDLRSPSRNLALYPKVSQSHETKNLNPNNLRRTSSSVEVAVLNRSSNLLRLSSKSSALAVPPDTDTCDIILAVDWERGKVEVGRETWEALAVSRLGTR
jgi:hypothetical protein